jgi:REP element-mobilizing transposase RayT
VPRPPRFNVADGIYHVTARGNRLQAICLEDADYRLFLRLVGRVAGRQAWHCLAFCLITNHYHLVLRTPNADLSVGMHRLNSEYAHWFNERHGLVGHVFQKRFHAVLVESDRHLLELSRYLALNPVRAGLCSDPRAWRWSSYGALLGGPSLLACLAVEEALGHFGRNSEEARRAFERFVDDGLPEAPLAA